MGIASATAQIYARYRIPSIPLYPDKRPAVRGFKIASLTVGKSRAYMRAQPDADALGIPDGRLSGLVRLDIDVPGDAVVAEVIRRAGDTPFKVRTASGKFHLVYRFNGERRLTARPVIGKRPPSNAQPWDDLCVDLCGEGGYSVSPPSRCNGGTYDLVGEVSLEQLLARRNTLPTIQGLEARAYLSSERPKLLRTFGEPEPELTLVRPGNRDAIFYREVARICQRLHRAGATKEDAIAHALARNRSFPVPLDQCEVTAKVNYWWERTVRGENQFGRGQQPSDGAWAVELASTDPALFALLSVLQKLNGPEAEFWISNGFAGTRLVGWWSLDRLRSARQRALDGGWLVQIRRATKGIPALYCWGPTAFATMFGRTKGRKNDTQS